MTNLSLPKSHQIRSLEYINKEEYDQITHLMELCCQQEKINLKLELDYKLHLASIADRNTDKLSSDLNEFLYYVEEKLVAYLGICCFDGITGEITGMTHPDYRGQGFITRLLELARKECGHRSFSKLLFLTDGNSQTGMEYVKRSALPYDHSEYRMKRLSASTAFCSETSALTLRPACQEDEPAIARMNHRIFNDSETNEHTGEPLIKSLAEDPENYKTYIIELAGERIGKINVEYYDNYAFITGFGIQSEYRGKGYGRTALNATLKMIEAMNINTIELDVVCTNKQALPLYQSCGFQELSVMNYYLLPAIR